MKVKVIGAGPCGCIAAALAAAQGYNVEVYEEHKEIGLPVRCAGLVSKLAIDLFSSIGITKNYIVNRINKLAIHFASKAIDIAVEAFVISRQKFDQQCAELAERYGAKILTKRALPSDLSTNGVVIGADGVNSFVAAHFGFPDMKKVVACQSVGLGDFEKGKASVFLFTNSFGYVIPENEESARIGLCFFGRSQLSVFESFVKNFANKSEGTFCATIPAEVRAQVQKQNIFLVGDAAGTVKATSFGGLYYGCKSALLAAKCVGDLSYEKRFRSEILPELRKHQIARTVMNCPIFSFLFLFCPRRLTYDMENVLSLRIRQV